MGNLRRKKLFVIIPCLTLLCLAFQNCQKGFTTTVADQLASGSSALPGSSQTKECVSNGTSFKAGETLIGYSLYSVVSPAVCGAKVTRTCLASGSFDGPVPVYETCTQLSPQANAIDALPPGEWMEVPNSMLRDVFPAVSPGGSSYAVVAAWSGGAFDTKRDRLIVWGGGHADYAGNEIYVFDLNTLKWTRLTEPSSIDTSVAQFDSGYYPDGLPVSRHTYNSLQYVPDPVDRFCAFGGGGLWKSGQYNTNHVDCFNFDKNVWETQKFPDSTSAGIGSNTAYDPVTQSIWQHAGIGDMGMSRLDLKTGKWSQLWAPFSNAGYTLGYHRTSAIDPINRKMVAVGEGKIISWDLNKDGLNYGTEIATSGPQDIVVGTGGNPGFEYIPELKAFVGWAGGSNLYKLDMLTLAWTALPPSPNSSVVPPVEQKNWGTYGRFRYSPNKKVLVLVAGENQNVLVYKVK